nr:MAG TPA: hypothetical protein [Caudoviricetes sp.]
MLLPFRFLQLFCFLFFYIIASLTAKNQENLEAQKCN